MRQQEADVAVLLPSIRELTERQYQLFFLFQNVIAQTGPEGLSRVTDADVAEAAATVAGSLETAARGIIYEQSPQSPTARKLADGFRALMVQVREQGATLFDREAAITLRAIEQGAKTVGGPADTTGTGYIDLVGRLLQVKRAQGGCTRQRLVDHRSLAGSREPEAGSLIQFRVCAVWSRGSLGRPSRQGREGSHGQAVRNLRQGSGGRANRVARPQRRSASVRAQSPDGAGARERRRPPHPGLHPVPAQRQGHQGCLTCGRQITSDDAPKAQGVYTPAIRAGQLLFVSGQIPVDPKTGAVVDGDITAQADQAMRNVSALLKAAGLGFEHVARTTVFLAD